MCSFCQPGPIPLPHGCPLVQVVLLDLLASQEGQLLKAGEGGMDLKYVVLKIS